MCRVLGVSRSGFYAWQHRPLPRREERNDVLVKRIREVHARSHGTYGSPRVHRVLRKRGFICGRNRVARLMQRESIIAISQHRFMNTSTSTREVPAGHDLLRRCFRASKPNRVWVSDMTFLSTRQGWVHLCVVLDLHSRRCVGWAVGSRPTQQLACAALRNALEQRRPDPGLVLHTDRGSAYLSYGFQELLDERGIRMSTSRPGNCLDNAVAESFFKTLKTEMYYHRVLSTQQEARQALFEYIEAFYNPIRLHSTLDYVSPADYEENVA